ncbi:MAG: tRNA1(Val) (adenine(37)-N6)-methyltransferase, partial [Planktomarina sp.]
MTTTVDAFLGGRLQILQPADGYRAGMDAVMLAAACPLTSGQTVMDLGCGVGTAGLCLAARTYALVTGVELLTEQVDLAVQNATANDLSMTIVQGDATARPTPVCDQSFDHVITNPPYFRYGHGKLAADATRATGRSGDVDLGLWIGTAHKRLNPKGWLTLIQRIDRLPHVLAACGGFGDMQVLPITARTGRPPDRFILRAKKSARGAFKMLPAMVMHEGASHEKDGESFTQVVRDVLR